MLAPLARVPDLGLMASHVLEGVQVTVQLIEAVPVFVSVYLLLPGLNIPPFGPEDVNPSDGTTERTPPEPPTVSDTLLVVFPWPLVVFVKETVSLYVPAGREFAFELIETVSVVLPPDESVPEVLDRVTQFTPTRWLAVQLMLVLPGLLRVYTMLDGENGPPTLPDEASPLDGETERDPPELVTVSTALLVVVPLLVVSLKYTVAVYVPPE
jgi:hypothetical protein